MYPSQSLRVFAVTVGLLHVFASAAAYASSASERQTARAERSLGAVALNLGNYDEAVEHFSRAYSLEQDPTLLFSLGQAFRLAGKADKALAAYSAFLRAAGNGPKYRGQIERAAAEIESITSFMLKQPVDTRPSEKAVTAKEAASVAVEPAPAAEAAAPREAEVPVAKVETAVPLATPAPPPPPSPALALAPAKAEAPAEKKSRPVYSRWWFWTGVAGAVAAGSVATWYYAQPSHQAPASTYGSVRVLP
jgi:tetratricopeptide (TPR) repeat protein